MKTKMQLNNIRIFAVETSFSSFPSYVICTAERVNDREYRGESFLLHINNAIKARLIAKEVLIQSENMNSELFSDIDDDFVIEECLNQGKTNMYESYKTKIIFDHQSIIKNIVEIDMNYLLHGNFAHENIRKKLLLIGERTKIEKLKQYINAVSDYSYADFTTISKTDEQ
jgi:hypothetical protein